jgi:hypothetical protein
VGYFETHADLLASLSFQKDARGRTLFYPCGILGKARVLDGPWDAVVLRAKIVRFYRALFKISMYVVPLLLAVLVGVAYFGYPNAVPYVFLSATIAASVAAGTGMALYMLHLTSHYPVSDERVSYAQHVRHCATKFSHGQLLRSAFFSLVCAAPFVLRILHGHFDVFTLALVVLFGGLSINTAWIVVSKLRAR